MKTAVRIGFNVIDAASKRAPDHEPRSVRVILEVHLWGEPMVGDEIDVDGWTWTVRRRHWDSDGLYVWGGHITTSQMRAWDGTGPSPTPEAVAERIKRDAAAEMVQVREAMHGSR